jgi:hypothetical protein
MAKQALLLEEQAGAVMATAGRHMSPLQRQRSRQQQQQGSSDAEEAHAAELARVLTHAIFASVLAAAPPSPGPQLHLPPGAAHRVQDIPCATGSISGSGGSSRSPVASGSGRRHCRITAAALATGGSPPSGSRSVRRQLLPTGGCGAGTVQSSPAGMRSGLSQAAEAVRPGAWGPGSFTGAAALAEVAAEVARLDGALEETAAECER